MDYNTILHLFIAHIQTTILDYSISILVIIGSWLLRKFTRNELKLIKSSKYFKLYESSGDALILLDKYEFLECNTMALTLFGYDTQEEFCKRSMTKLSVLEQPDGWLSSKSLDAHAKTSKETGHDRFEWVFMRKDGSLFWAEVTLNTVDHKDTQLFTAVITDISVRKHLESEINLAATVFESQEGIIVTDSDRFILRVNASFTRITGYSSEQAIGRMPSMFSSGRHNTEFYKTLWHSINTTGTWSGEIWNRRENGEIYETRSTITAVKDCNDNVEYYVSIFAEIFDDDSISANSESSYYSRMSQCIHDQFGSSVQSKLDTVASITEYILPIRPETSVKEAIQIFSIDSNQAILPLVRGNIALGLIFREYFLPFILTSECGIDAHFDNPILDYVNTATISFDCNVSLSAASNQLLLEKYQDSAFVVTRSGRYIGVMSTQTLFFALTKLRMQSQDVAEKKLMKTGAYNRGLIESSFDGMAILDDDGIITDVNLATERLLGLSRDSILGTNFSHYFIDQNLASEIHETAAINGVIYDYPLTVKHSDGKLIDVLYNATTCKGINTETCMTLVSTRDITSQKTAHRLILEKEQMFNASQSALSVGSWSIDLATRCVSFSDEMLRILDIPIESFDHTLDSFLIVVHPEDRKALCDSIEDSIKDSCENHADFRVVHSDGQIYHIHGEGRIQYDSDNVALRLSGHCQDVTQIVNTTNKLKIADTVFESKHGMIITDANKMILRVNEAFTSITGKTLAEVVNTSLASLIESSLHDSNFYVELFEAIDHVGFWEGELWCTRKDGISYPEYLTITSVYDSHSQISNFICAFEDLATKNAESSKFHRFAYYDTLTNLPNRIFLLEKMQHYMCVCERDHVGFAVLVFNINNFKVVNENYGHAAGDKLLQCVADRLIKHLRKIDTVARLRCDEYAVLLTNVNQNVATRLTKKLTDALSLPFKVLKNDIVVSCSVGISMYPHNGTDSKTLLDNAYAASNNAKNDCCSYAYYSASLTFESNKRIEYESSLRNACKMGELCVHYQPVYDAQCECVVGAKTILMWNHAELGLMHADKFVTTAEEIGIMSEICEYVLRTVCKQGKSWIDHNHKKICLSVSISVQQFQRGDLCSTVKDVLLDTGFPASCLDLNFTESCLLYSRDTIKSTLLGLSNLGVRLTIDSFGSGFSAPANFKNYPINSVIIDRNFIADMQYSEDSFDVVTSLISIGHILKCNVIADGVETVRQFDHLKLQKCDYFIGSLIGSATSAELFTFKN
jgi:diguanylate cyclase (GGDEF)-like protein/PAS domain S-box-containing protein